MPLTRKILKNINILNAILISGLLFFIFKVLLPSYRIDVTPVIDITTKPAKETVIEDTKKEETSPIDYSIISENNLFHPERKFVTKPKIAEKPLPRPEFVLYGTLISGDIKVAYMEDMKSPYATSGRGKRQRSVHLGETVSGYTLKEIYNDRVVMVRDDDRIEVKVLDSSKKKHTRTEPVQPTTPKPPKPTVSKNRQPPVKPEGEGTPPPSQ